MVADRVFRERPPPLCGRLMVIGALVATADTGQRVQMDPAGLTRWRSDDEGGLIRSINIGGSDADELALYDPQGRLLSGLMSDGSGVVRGEHSVGSLRVGGDRLEDLLDLAPRGRIAHFRTNISSQKAGDSQLGLVRFSNVPLIAGRLYRFWLSGSMVASAPTNAAFRIRTKSGGIPLTVANGDLRGGRYRHAAGQCRRDACQPVRWHQ